MACGQGPEVKYLGQKTEVEESYLPSIIRYKERGETHVACDKMGKDPGWLLGRSGMATVRSGGAARSPLTLGLVPLAKLWFPLNPTSPGPWNYQSQ